MSGTSLLIIRKTSGRTQFFELLLHFRLPMMSSVCASDLISLCYFHICLPLGFSHFSLYFQMGRRQCSSNASSMYLSIWCPSWSRDLPSAMILHLDPRQFIPAALQKCFADLASEFVFRWASRVNARLGFRISPRIVLCFVSFLLVFELVVLTEHLDLFLMVSEFILRLGCCASRAITFPIFVCHRASAYLTIEITNISSDSGF